VNPAARQAQQSKQKSLRLSAPTTLAQGDLPQDLSVLWTSAKHHGDCAGVFGVVQAPGGLVRVGDPVSLWK
jgi:hypothetical protein